MDQPEPLRGLRVLVVEDNYVLAESIAWTLGLFGAEVLGPASSCEKAEALLGQHIDAAVLDIDLQGATSAPIAGALQARGVPFVFLTGYERPTLLPEALRAMPYLAKPIDPEELAEFLARLLRRS